LVTSFIDDFYAKNGQVFTLTFLDEGDIPPVFVYPCGSYSNWNATVNVVREGSVSGITAESEKVINGVVQRGTFNELYVSGDTEPSPSSLPWNILPEPSVEKVPGTDYYMNISIKEYIENVSTRVVNVTRTVIGQYGVVEWVVTFVYNEGQTPTGSGDVNLLEVNQTAAFDGKDYAVTVYENVKGSTGITGSFLIDTGDVMGTRTVYYDDTPENLEAKLNEYTNIGHVKVTKIEYPSTSSGGWGDVRVSDGTKGGFEFRLHFTKNLGPTDGLSYPQGTGNVDPIQISYKPEVDIFGTAVTVEAITLSDGSEPIAGDYSISFKGDSVLVQTHEHAEGLKYNLQDLNMVGTVNVTMSSLVSQKLEGMKATVMRDAQTVSVSYDTRVNDLMNPYDIRNNLTAGDLVSFGEATTYRSLSVSSLEPIASGLCGNSTCFTTLLPGQVVSIEQEEYVITKTGAQVQKISVFCGSDSSHSIYTTCGFFRIDTQYNSTANRTGECIGTHNGVMTTAEEMHRSLAYTMDVPMDSLYVTRTDRMNSRSYLFTIYLMEPHLASNTPKFNLVFNDATCQPPAGESTMEIGNVQIVGEGGSTAVHTVRVNVNQGYVVGDMFQLKPSGGSTWSDCFTWGASADVVQHTLNSEFIEYGTYELSSIHVKVSSIVSDTIHLVIDGQDKSLFGILKRGDKVKFKGHGGAVIDAVATVLELTNGTHFSVSSENTTAMIGITSDLDILIIQEGVQVHRDGTGIEMSTEVEVSATADMYVKNYGRPYFKLNLELPDWSGGITSLQTGCLPYHATAEQVSNAINALNFDFDGDGAYDADDKNHITVTRRGDGMASSGFGYTYNFKFEGPQLEYVSSIVLGHYKPHISVVSQGYPSCKDLNSSSVDPTDDGYESLTATGASMTGGTTWTITGSSLQGVVFPGSQIKVPSSDVSTRIFTVRSVTAPSTLEVDMALPGSNTDSSYTIVVVHEANPQYSVKTVVDGEDAYSYKMFFTGAHLGDVNLIDSQACATGIKLYNGMRSSVVSVKTQAGGEEIELGTEQISFNKGYVGQGDMVSKVIVVEPPTFTIQDQDVDVTQILTNIGSMTDLSYKVTLTVSTSLTSTSYTSSCIQYNDIESVVQAAIVAPLLGTELCDEDSEKSDGYKAPVKRTCVVVTRQVDDVLNPGGFVYNVYFNDPQFYQKDFVTSVSVTPYNDNACSVSHNSASHTSYVDASEKQSALKHWTFGRASIPLALAGDSSILTSYYGQDASNVNIYRRNGDQYRITFESAMDDVSALVAMPSQFLKPETVVSVTDNVVRGISPVQTQIHDLDTGIMHFGRIAAYTETVPNMAGGYSTFTTSSNAVTPGVEPSPVTGLSTAVSLAVPETQTLTIAAKHITAKTSVTTSAYPIGEIQNFIVSGIEGKSVEGNITLRTPEVQRIVIIGENAQIMDMATFKIRYNRMKKDFPNGIHNIGVLAKHSVESICLNVSSDASTVKLAMDEMSGLGDGSVRVIRSGNGGPYDKFGWTYDISFIGDNVAGDVLEVEALQCSTFSGVSFEVSTLNQGQASGLDTGIQYVTVHSSKPIVEGAYVMSLGSVNYTTGCVNWNASANEFQKELQSLDNIDAVEVVRKDAGNGYMYEVFFTGNSFFTHQFFDPGALAELVFHRAGDGTEVADGCDSFAYFADGTLQTFGSDASVTTEVIRNSAIDVPASSPDVNLIKAKLNLLPHFNIVSIVSNIPDVNGGYTLTFVYDTSMGDVALLACGSDSTFDNSFSKCTPHTEREGNIVTGYFQYGDTEPISSNASPYEFENKMALAGYGVVAVTVSDADEQLGRTWVIDWVGTEGPAPVLTATNLLLGAGAKVSVSQNIREGNYLGGCYVLFMNTDVTSCLPYDSDAGSIQTALVPLVGTTVVTKVGAASEEGGSSFTITYNDLPGNIENLGATYMSTLTGVDAVVKVTETIKGSLAVGTNMKFSFNAQEQCSNTPVQSGTCGSPVDEYKITVGDSFGYVDQRLNLAANYHKQIISIHAPDLYPAVYTNYDEASGFFSFQYNGVNSPPMSVTASSETLRHMIEALPDVNVVSVTKTISSAIVPDVTVMVSQGDTNIVATGLSSGTLLACDLIKLGRNGAWYSILESYDGVASTIPLGEYMDCSIAYSFKEANLVNAMLQRWDRGNEYQVEFISVATEYVFPLSIQTHAINPSSAYVSVRPEDCVDCLQISNLVALQNYFVKIQACNSFGCSAQTTVEGAPNAIPNAPSAVIANVLSGTSVRLFWHPPFGDNDVDRYTIQWSTSDRFENAEIDGACGTSGYGSCEVSGNAIAGAPPYQYIVNYLSSDTRYYFRIASRNDISSNPLSPESLTKWSDVVDATAKNQAPAAPSNIEVSVASINSVQVLVDRPVTNGGSSIDHYLIECDSSAGFDNSATYTSSTFASSTLVWLDADTFVVEMGGLTPGSSYYCQASASNSIGYSLRRTSVIPAAVGAKPGAPTNVKFTTAIESSQPITSTIVSWDGPTTDNGFPVTQYKVEYWTNDRVKDVQVIKHYSDVALACDYKLCFSTSPGIQGCTGLISDSTPSSSIRSALINLGWDPVNSNYTYDTQIGDVQVSKSVVSGLGTEIVVTFESLLNEGNMPLLQPTLFCPGGHAADEVISVVKRTIGQREFGLAEKQIISLLASNTDNSSDITGFFRLSFNGSLEQTGYINVWDDAEVVEKALSQLDTIGIVSVNKVVTSFYGDDGIWYAGYNYSIWFNNDEGDQPSIGLDSSYLQSAAGAVKSIVFDGDNSMSSSKTKFADTFPGEEAKQYNMRIVDSTTRSFTINHLVAGETYYASVRAVNSRGHGLSMEAPSTTLPLQHPTALQNVMIGVHAGSSTSLDVSFDAPLSNGGAQIMEYLVELDVDAGFSNPIQNTINCPAANKKSVFEVYLHGTLNDPLMTGNFKLRVAHGGSSYVTDVIPWDFTNNMEDETGIAYPIEGVTANVHDGNATIRTSIDASTKIFKGDRIVFPSNLVIHDDAVYTVTSVDYHSPSIGTIIHLDMPVDLQVAFSTSDTTISRYLGGRGLSTSSKITCDADSVLCSLNRRETSGSLQGKIKSTNALIAGVVVDRDTIRDSYGGIKVRVKVLDDSPATDNYAITVETNNLQTVSGAAATISVDPLVEGVSYSMCTGTFEMPSGGQALAVGQHYYARVTAKNDISYGPSSSSPTSEKPQVVPGAPTSVILSNIDSSILKVTWNAPAYDGGAAVISYRITYSLSSDFSGASTRTEEVTLLEDGAPFHKLLKELTEGAFYYTKIQACNVQGCGDATGTVPASLNPHSVPGVPNNVVTRVVSDSALNVVFDLPDSNGGDSIDEFYISWDTTQNFNSASNAMPHKGFVEVDASKYRSYTIQHLKAGQEYFVKVAAKNSAGIGEFTTPSEGVVPMIVIPGRVASAQAFTGSVQGSVKLQWNRPLFPWFGLPCSGSVDLGFVYECPKAYGGGEPMSTGGLSVTHYEIHWSEQSDFMNDYDVGKITTNEHRIDITGLTPNRQYYFRIYTRTNKGPSPPATKIGEYGDGGLITAAAMA
jgi:hypothetical protein